MQQPSLHQNQQERSQSFRALICKGELQCRACTTSSFCTMPFRCVVRKFADFKCRRKLVSYRLCRANFSCIAVFARRLPVAPALRFMVLSNAAPVSCTETTGKPPSCTSSSSVCTAAFLCMESSCLQGDTRFTVTGHLQSSSLFSAPLVDCSTKHDIISACDVCNSRVKGLWLPGKTLEVVGCRTSRLPWMSFLHRSSRKRFGSCAPQSAETLASVLCIRRNRGNGPSMTDRH